MRVTVAVDVLMREATILVECFNVLISRGLGWGHDDDKVHAVCRYQEAASAQAHKGVVLRATDMSLLASHSHMRRRAKQLRDKTANINDNSELCLCLCLCLCSACRCWQLQPALQDAGDKETRCRR